MDSELSSEPFPKLAETLTWRDAQLVNQTAIGARRDHLTFVSALMSRVAAHETDDSGAIGLLAQLSDEDLTDILGAP